ncbi:MAG: sugar phosphate nucleotidyltransferase [Candidatus Shapirobacteria bacterium]|nr:sugar phosphate nucleotidyltransferase [Candidatus Shapirobacteria bacterium]
MPITKAVITAAGRGTRFLPVVKAYVKELIAILDKPNIQYLVEEMIGAGITDIAIVKRPGSSELEKYFTPDSELEKYLTENNKLAMIDSLKFILSKAKITFIDQTPDLPYGNGTPILAAADFIGTDSFVYAFGDDLSIEAIPGTFLSQMITTFAKYQPSSVIAVEEVPPSEINRYASMKYIDDPLYPHRISGLFEKLPAETAPSLFGQGGRFILSNIYIDTLKNTAISKGELWLTDASNFLAKNGIVLTQTLPHGVWMTTGDPLRWLKANIILGLKHPVIGPELKKFLDTV